MAAGFSRSQDAPMPDDATRPPTSSRGDLDEMPVEDLIRLTREFTRRVTNEDRQRETLALRESGHHRSVQTGAPVALQQFFAGEIDLDAELARRFANPPLMVHVRFEPEPGEPLRRQASAIFTTNDSATTLTLDVPLDDGEGAALEFTFTLAGTLGLRFHLAPLPAADRRRWLGLMQRASGITFLWTRQRWEAPYLVFVVRETYGRVYAFSPAGLEAAARLTPGALADLTRWLSALWFPAEAAPDAAAPPRDAVDLSW